MPNANPPVYRDAKLFVPKVSDSLTEKFVQLKSSDMLIYKYRHTYIGSKLGALILLLRKLIKLTA